MDVDQLDRVLLVGAAVLLVAVVAVRASVRTGAPSLLLYVGLGLLLGEDVVGVRFDDEQLARVLGYAALVVILAEGGLTTRWRTIRPAMPAAALLATVGVAVSVVVTGLAARLLLDVGWRGALLLGAVVSSTDAAAVFSVLRRAPLPRRLTGTLEAESGLNDAPVVILVVALAGSAAVSVAPLLGLLVLELVGGAAVGLLVGWLGTQGARRVALPTSGLYPLAVLGTCVVAYGAAAVAHLSGFLAVYVCALVLGNARLPHRPATRGFAEGMGWLAQIGLFVMLGLLATPSELGPALLPAVGIGLALTLVARPLAVLASVLPLRLSRRARARGAVPDLRETVFLSWAGLRGAVPIVLATVPVSVGGVAGLDGRELFNLVFVLVVLFTALQGPTLPWLARRLRLSAEGVADVEIESSPLSRLRADLLEITVPAGSRLHGVTIAELRLPPDVSVTLVVRDGRTFVPDARTVLRRGDELLVVATEDARTAAEERLQAVSRHGRLAGWVDRP